ncbi:hypothetical protein [Flavobacterium alkalisoli]|uniref:hypothetical protein n=1 Tax=Flavobacterium alkalisoli TaxID=2602769 RepID=UPI003A8F37AC
MNFSKATEKVCIFKVTQDSNNQFEFKMFKWPSVKKPTFRSPKAYSSIAECRRAMNKIIEDYKGNWKIEIDDIFPKRNRQATA